MADRCVRGGSRIESVIHQAVLVCAFDGSLKCTKCLIWGPIPKRSLNLGTDIKKTNKLEPGI